MNKVAGSNAIQIAVTLAIVMVAVLVAIPGLMGIWVKHSYFQLIAFYNSQNNFKMAVQKYQQHWYCADVLVHVSKLDLPQVLNFNVKQHIQYGPVIFSGTDRPLFKMARVKSEFLISAIIILAFIHTVLKLFFPPAKNCSWVTRRVKRL
jgi:hypothetical protein